MAVLSLIRNVTTETGPENVDQLEELDLKRQKVFVSFQGLAELGLEYVLTFHSVTEDEENNTALLSDTSLSVSGAHNPTQSTEEGPLFFFLH